MIIVGLNAYHGDASACLVRDGELLAAAEEERFLRVKHWAGFPVQAIKYCLEEAGVGLDEVDVIAINSDPKAHFLRKALFTLRHKPDPRLVLDRLRNAGKRLEIEELLGKEIPGGAFKGVVERVEHHVAHLSSCFHVSPFDEAVVVSVDGFGDFSSAAWGTGRGSKIDVQGRVHFPHSLGVFYQAVTQYLGFPHYGDEYKVMGLAPYGEPKFVSELRQIVHLQEDGGYRLDLDYFRHVRERIPYAWENGSPSVGSLFTSKFDELLGPSRGKGDELEQRHMDIARSAQVVYEEAFYHLLNSVQKSTGLDTLCLAGGCAMNSVANGKIKLRTGFKNLYIQSAAGDAGGAIGAAFQAWHTRSPKRSFVMKHAYYGPSATSEEVDGLLEVHAERIAEAKCEIVRPEGVDELCKITATAISEGKVIGWFQGRLEWGPRALGNRSIVCDPRRADMKEILNLKIKRRESFRPFAPSVLREAVPEWFEQDGDVPFMMQVFQIIESQREKIPAVTHADGSGRLQTVYQDTNPRYYKLIEAFRDITGVPMVLNTSFNENEPVVCRPGEALDCFLRTSMDYLVLNDVIVRRA